MLSRIGDIEIWRILETVDPFLTPQQFFPAMDDDGLALFQREAPRQICPETGHMLLPIQGFLIKTAQHAILIDACLGHGKTCSYNPLWHQRSGGRFMTSLAAAGVAPEDIDYVMCTHLHIDHVGWNTRLENGTWVPTFANARYLLPAADNEHFRADPGDVYNESVLPVIEAGQAELVSDGHMLGDHVSLLPTPGHTPGHVSVRIADGGREAVVSGDVMHSTIQCLKPDWSFCYDNDKLQAAVTRRRFLEETCEHRRLLLGSHFPLPSLGHVAAHGDAFRFIEP